MDIENDFPNYNYITFNDTMLIFVQKLYMIYSFSMNLNKKSTLTCLLMSLVVICLDSRFIHVLLQKCNWFFLNINQNQKMICVR